MSVQEKRQAWDRRALGDRARALGENYGDALERVRELELALGKLAKQSRDEKVLPVEEVARLASGDRQRVTRAQLYRWMP